MILPNNLSKLISIFRTLPGIGYNMAVNISLYLLQKDYKEIEFFTSTLLESKKKLFFCKVCGNISDNDICNICSDETREKSVICVVGEVFDILAIEKTREYNGQFHVLGGHISPLNSAESLNIDSLLLRIKNGNIKEIIIATNSTVEGETTALYLYNILSKFNIKITRIAKGVPVGLDLGYVDSMTIAKSLENRVLFLVKGK